jgi:hypothetical protein
MIRALFLSVCVLSAAAFAGDGEEVELSSAPVTALSCAQKAVETGKLDLLTACPLEETKTGLVVFDVAEMAYYRLDKKGVRTSDLERAFGGGSVDVTGKVKKADPKDKDKVTTVEVSELRVTPKPKPGAFKGCL